jgi:SAM-dependent methyltransferase
MERERAFYEIPENWENFTLTEVIREKIGMLRSMIPPDVATILDLGCGNGLITNALADGYRVVGLDWSLSALSLVRVPRICARAGALPVRPRCVDLLLCSELLEHLLEDEFQRAIGEILRLGPRYLLLTVPNEENLMRNALRCPECGMVFNASHHQRSFDLERLTSLFPAYELQRWEVHGPPVRAYPNWLLRIRQRVGGRWFQVPEGRTVQCPRCGSTRFPKKRYNPVSLCCDALNRLVSRRRPYWLFALLVRRAP